MISETHLEDIAKMFGISQRLVCRVKNGIGCYGNFDKDYFNAQEKRFKNYKSQLTLKFAA